MGLDAVELSLDVEDHFGIKIRDAEAEQIRQVGDLVALIHRRMTAAAARTCPSMAAFLSLRKAVRDTVGDQTFRVRPRDRVTERLSPHLRRQLWRKLSHLLGTEPRSLRRPPPFRQALAAISLLLIIVAIAVASVDWQILPLSLLLAALVIFLLYSATARYCNTPPDGWATMGEITRQLMGTTVATANLQLDDEQAVLAELRPIIADVLGVDPARIVMSARFVEDLGLS